MGEPWFKLAPRAKEWGLVALSSNYELYGDISARVMELLGRYSAWLEVYSIDEAFLGVKGTPAELLALGRAMKAAVRRNVGVPVCVGIAPTTGIDEYFRVAYYLPGWRSRSSLTRRDTGVPIAERVTILVCAHY